ncbi:MAG TPA: glycosyltransferase [Terriglobia bacterium]|nr:glycosyltransferase [Terriglobia bacterium]
MLTILNVAYPLAPVGFGTAGGSEQIIALLDAALTEGGHRSIVVGCVGSEVKGSLVATSCRREYFRESRSDLYAEYRAAIWRSILRYKPDVIHLHGIDVHNYVPPAGLPALITLHLPPEWYSPNVFNLDRPQTYLNCVSLTQQKACPSSARLLPFIKNGVPVNAFRAQTRKRRFALVLARVCPEKGIHLAIDAAAAAGMPVVVGGEVFPYNAYQRYFSEEIAPRLNGKARFLGPVGFRRKRRLLSRAKCVLIPALAPETSSLVAMEALASGTPVVAFAAGALPEIVEDGVTGFLVSSKRQMAAAIRRVKFIDPRRCRRAAVDRFSSEDMVRRYLELYAELNHNSSHPDAAHSVRTGMSTCPC